MTREHRVYGPPGTGKTTFLARQAKLATEKYGRGAVMVASLTRAAAQEVAGRDTGIPRQMIGTLHAHAFRALDRPMIAEVKEGIADWNDWIAATDPNLKLGTRGLTGPENDAPGEVMTGQSDGDKLLAELSIIRARGMPVEAGRQAVRRFDLAWRKWKDESGRMDFTDLIERAAEDCPKPPGDPAVMMLDEAQDLSALEMRLARVWGESVEQFVSVGDPYQNLYQWRGSDPAAFSSTEAATTRVLEQSYRVPEAVHRYAVDWVQAAVPEGEDFPAYQPTDEPGELFHAERRFVEPAGLLPLIRDDLDAGMSVMVLGSCGFMVDPMVKLLKAEGIPFHNPYRPAHGGWNPMRAAQSLLAYQRPNPQVWMEEARQWTWDDLRRWTDPLTARGVLTRGTKTFIEAKCQKDRTGGDGGEDLAPIDTVIRLFEEEHWDYVFDYSIDWWESHLRASKANSLRFPLEVMRKHGGAALRAKPNLIIGTIHSVKGGEADSVYVFPDLSRIGYWTNWMKPEGRPAITRQFYVAFTRARRKLTICDPSAQEYVPMPTIEKEAA